MAFLLFGLFCALSFGSAALCGRRFEQTLPLSFFGLILLLYICGLCGSVMVGVWLAWTLSAAALLVTAWALLRRKMLWTQLVTPGLFVFAFCFFGFWIVQTGRRPVVSDDFSHWARVVKNMYYIGGFGNGQGTNTLFREYPPAMALLEFFFVKSGCVFQDDMMYRASSIFLCALQIPIFRHIGWRQAWKALLLLPIVVLMPMLFFEEVYICLYVDATLGLLLVYLLYNFFEGKLDAFVWISASLAAAVLALTKPSGFGLACIGLLILTLQGRTWRMHADSGEVRSLRSRAAWAALPWGMAFLAYFSWRIYFQSLELPAAFTLGRFSLQSLIDLLQRRAPASRYEIIRGFYNNLVRHRHYGADVSVTFFDCIQLIGLAGIICASLRPREKQGEMIWVFGGLMAGFAAYAGSLLSMYLFVFSGSEATGLASMSRYMGTYLLASFGFLAHMALRDAITKKSWQRPILVALLCVVVMHPFINWALFRRSTYLAKPQINYSQEALRPYEELRKRVKEVKGASVYCLSQAGPLYEASRMLYVFMPEVLLDGWRLPVIEEGKSPARTMGDMLAQKGHTHVYLLDINETFADTHAELFVDQAVIAQDRLYRVMMDGDRVTLAWEP